MRFNKPPLVELMVELRWLPAGVPAGPDGQPAPMPANVFAAIAANSSEQLYMRFAGLIGAAGFVQSERLVPAPFQGFPFQPIYRYSRSGTKPGEPIYQLGAGHFSAHITPPYNSWDEFRPFLEAGFTALLEAREGAEREAVFNAGTVRYIDCFSEQFRQGATSGKFLSDVLGIEIKAPAAITKLLAPNGEITPAVNLGVPLANGRQLMIQIADGQTPTMAGLIMNSSISTSRPIPANRADVMQFLDEAHAAISDMFQELTMKLHSVMEPIK